MDMNMNMTMAMYFNNNYNFYLLFKGWMVMSQAALIARVLNSSSSYFSREKIQLFLRNFEMF